MRGWAWMVGLLVLGCGGDGTKAGTGGDGSTNAGGTGESSSGGANGGAVSAGGSSAGGSSAGGSSAGGSGAGGSSVASAGASAGVAGGGPADVYTPTITEREGCRPKGPTLEQIPGARLVKKADGIDDIDSLLLLDGSLYFAIRRDIFRLTPPTAAAASAQLVADAAPTIWALFGGGGALYSVNTNFRQLWRTSLASLPAEPELIAEDVSETGMLADDENLYFSGSNGGGIHVLPFTAAAPGAVPIELVPTVKSLSLAAADGYLYYIDYQSVYRVPVTGGERELQFSVGAPRSLAVDNGVVYVAASESVLRWTPSANLAYTTLATGSRRSETSQYNNEVEWLKVIGDRVYYREDDGSFAWVKTDASDCRIIVKLEDNGFQNQQYAVTDSHYYVIVDDTELYEIPR